MSFIPGLKLADAAGSAANSAAKHFEAGATERATEAEREALNVAVQQQLLAGAEGSSDSLDTLVAHAAEQTAQTTSKETTKQSKERTRRILILTAGGLVATLGLVAGAGILYGEKRAGDAADNLATSAGKLGDAIKTIFTEQEVSAAEIQNVANSFSLPGKTIVEETGMSGSIDVQTQGQFAGIQAGQSTDIPATVCGAQQTIVDFNNPGVEVGADQLPDGKKTITLQIPIDAIQTQFVPGTTFGSDGRLLSQCESQTPTNGFFTKVGSTSQENVALYEQASLTSNCLNPTLSLLDEGIRNAARGTFKFGSLGRSAVDKMLKATPQEQAKTLAIEKMLATMNITINYVKPDRLSDASGKQTYAPADISSLRFGIPTQPNKNQLADALGEDPNHVTIPSQDMTQCLMTAVGSDTYQKIKSNPQQVAQPSAGVSN